ncbi:DUF2274 domain-containing protein [Bradyrhizobium sp. ORS 285]|uniref:DUF2274 domain-containing protein n=1 Tax=Bradyrhizobium sp. ORS 285 TaxID=115808 RepID=UPI0007C79D80|nr:DUF2274 domain-containing protein [Bradyrhizobium sp. ORS 285]
MAITLPEPLKPELDEHAAEYSRLYEPVGAAALIPHMVEAFIRSDRGYGSRKAHGARRRGRQRDAGVPGPEHDTTQGNGDSA